MITKNEVKFIKSLSKKSERTEAQMFVAEGDKLIYELIKSGLKIDTLYTTSRSDFSDSDEMISSDEMARISNLKSPPSSLALVEIPVRDVEFKGGLGVVLDNVQDPGNLGTIIRICAWYGVKQIFCSLDTADCFSPKVVQATMGAIGEVEIIYTDLEPFLKDQTSRKCRILGTFLENSTPIYNVKNVTSDALLVMGNEGNGISVEVEEFVTDRIFLPSFGEPNCVESLNVAVATGIALSHLRKP